MGLGFIAGFLFCALLAGIMSNGKDTNDDNFNKMILEENKSLTETISNLQNQLDLPDHKRMEVSELEHQELKNKLKRSESSRQGLQNEIKLLNSFLDAVKPDREA